MTTYGAARWVESQVQDVVERAGSCVRNVRRNKVGGGVRVRAATAASSVTEDHSVVAETASNDKGGCKQHTEDDDVEEAQDGSAAAFAAVVLAVRVGSALGAAGRDHSKESSSSNADPNDENSPLQSVHVNELEAGNGHVNATEEEESRVHCHGSSCKEEKHAHEEGEAVRALLAAGPVLIGGFTPTLCHGACVETKSSSVSTRRTANSPKKSC